MLRGSKVFRWAGGICLGLAAIVMILGFTVFRGALDGTAYLVYWSICMVATLGAMFFAMLDFSSVKGRWRDEQQELIEKTLAASEEAARDRLRRN